MYGILIDAKMILTKILVFHFLSNILQSAVYCNVRKIAVTDRPPDHPDGRPDCLQKRGTNLSPSPPRMDDGPRHGPPYISSVDLQGTHSTIDQRSR